MSSHVAHSLSAILVKEAALCNETSRVCNVHAPELLLSCYIIRNKQKKNPTCLWLCVKRVLSVVAKVRTTLFIFSVSLESHHDNDTWFQTF